MTRALKYFSISLVALFSPHLVAAPHFSAICTLKSEHHYHLANSLDKKSKMINEWSTNDDRATTLNVSFSGSKHLDIIDSRQTEPLKAPIIFDNGNTLFAIYLAKGAPNGEYGGTTRTYTVNIEANAIVTTTTKSGNFMSASVQVSADGNPDCVFKMR